MNKILPLILLILITFVSYGVYKQANKSIKIKRLDCQAKTTTFERIFVEEPIKEAINSFKSNNYTIKSNIEYSKIMKSNLIDILNIKQADEILEKSIAANINTKNTHIEDEHKVLIDYYIYENDKDDSGKKNKENNPLDHNHHKLANAETIVINRSQPNKTPFLLYLLSVAECTEICS